MQQVKIIRTQGEWTAIDKKIKDMGIRNIRTHIKYQTIRLAKQFDECENCITKANGSKHRKTFYFDEYCMKFLELVALKMKKPLSSVVDDLIINPLLNERI